MLPATTVKPCDGATVLASLGANGEGEVVVKHLELTSVLAVVAVRAKEGRDDPATRAKRAAVL
jgi:hypothetical protein